MEVLGQRQPDQKSADAGNVSPPADSKEEQQEASVGPHQERPCGVGDNRSRQWAVERGLEGQGAELGRHDPPNEEEDDDPGTRKGKACRTSEKPPDDGVRQASECRDRGDVARQKQEGPDRPAERRRDDRLHQTARGGARHASAEEEEGCEDRVVHQARTGVPEHARLEDGVPDDSPKPPGNVPEVGRRAHRTHYPQVPPYLEREEGN